MEIENLLTAGANIVDKAYVSLNKLAERLGMQVATLEQIAWTLIGILLYVALRSLLFRRYDKLISDPTHRYFARKTTGYILTAVALVVILRIWFGGVSGMMTYLGLVSAGVAIALQDPLTNIAGWLFIVIRQPFAVRDRIQIGDHSGDVIDVRLFAFSILEIGNWVHADQSTGRIIHIPNGQVFKQPLANYTHGFEFIWNEIPVIVTYESNWEKARDILTQIVQRHTTLHSDKAAEQVQRAARKYLIFFDHMTPIVWVSTVDYGVALTLRYVCPPRQRRGSEHDIWCDILTAFAKEPDIELAYKTTRFYNRFQESQPRHRTHPQSPRDNG